MPETDPTTLATEAILASLYETLEGYYQDLAQGLGVSVAARFRLEGQLQLLLDAGVFSLADFQAKCEQWQTRYDTVPVDTAFWQWCALDNTLRLPLLDKPAPVYKG